MRTTSNASQQTLYNRRWKENNKQKADKIKSITCLWNCEKRRFLRILDEDYCDRKPQGRPRKD
jgi:predicted metal-binding protein